MGPGPVTVAPTLRPVRRRPWWWMLAALVAICAVAAIATYLTATRPGGRLDPEATGPDGGHALVALLRDHGVTVVVANSVDEAVNAARPGSLLLFGQTQRVTSETLMKHLADASGDLLLVEPTSRARAALSPGIRSTGTGSADDPRIVLCEKRIKRERWTSGRRTLSGPSATQTVTSCYGGALVRYRDGDRSVTVLGSTEFMTNGALLAGRQCRAGDEPGRCGIRVWSGSRRNTSKVDRPAKGKIFDLIPENVTWMVVQLWLTVALVALWKGRRIGPLVAEDLPVVVRASETVEGRGRLYRSRRARDRAAQALRTATLQRLLPRLGLGADAQPPAVVQAIAARNRSDPEMLRHILFGPPPATDSDLVQLSHALDDIERQVTQR